MKKNVPEKFSLRDFLFNSEKVTKIANEIFAVHPQFEKKLFITQTLEEFPKLELKQRITHIAAMLQRYLPSDYSKAVTILLKALPAKNDETKTDNDFGDFIYAPYGEFVARYGRAQNDFEISLNALYEITMRFSAEDAIRYFINEYPEQTFDKLLVWSTDPNYHVRRLTSEGTRPKLPWSQKITTPITKPLPILDNLFSDKTRYVTRSVANHINDISKIDPVLALSILRTWKRSGKQTDSEMHYIIVHSLRTLIKQGYKDALLFLDYSPSADVALTDFRISNTELSIGESLTFSFYLTAQQDENVIIDYILYFQNKKGQMNGKKVFKLKQLSLRKSQTLHITKKHPFRSGMTTRVLYPGIHKIEIQVNGKKLREKTFLLKTK